MTILIRQCNRVCMRKFEDMGNPRFLLIADPQGLFDESGDAIEGNNGGEGEGQQLVANAAGNHDLLQTYYLMVGWKWGIMGKYKMKNFSGMEIV